MGGKSKNEVSKWTVKTLDIVFGGVKALILICTIFLKKSQGALAFTKVNPDWRPGTAGKKKFD